MKARSINLCGLKIDGETQITPRTKNFLIAHNMHVTQENGMVSITGNFSIAKADVDAFLSSKAASSNTPKM